MNRKLDCLDGLRGLAILLVVLHHLDVHRNSGYHASIDSVLRWFWFGYSGVDLFLVLSGFCLTLSLLRRRASGNPPSLRSYLAARCRRIAPPYYASIAFGLVVPVAAGVLKGTPVRDLSVRNVLSHLLFVHGFWDDTVFAISPPFWSLSLEFQFYATLPLLFVAALRYGPRPIVLAVGVVSLAWGVVVAAVAPGSYALANGVFPGRWLEFALGMRVAFWFDDPARARGRGRTLAVASVAAAGLIGSAVALAASGFRPLTSLVYGSGAAALLAAVLLSSERRGRLGRSFEFGPLVRLGTISYSLYLTHVCFMVNTIALAGRLVPPRGPVSASFLVIAALTGIIIGGTAFYYTVERRFVRSVDGRPTRVEDAGPTADVPQALPGNVVPAG